MSNNAITTLTISTPTDMWFGDPCYVYPEARWGEFCKRFDGDGYKGSQALAFEENDHQFLTMDTAFGDGDYGLSIYNEFKGVVFVDSGSLAFIPLDLVREWGGDPSRGIVIRGFQGTVVANPDDCGWSGAIECITDGSEHDALDDWGSDDEFYDDDEDDDWAEAA